ncbi:MAG TPA: phage holin family protein [Solirubrobacteraceae bacterium]|nr:phage holin family protein [Solirubrobacteraceae bacterium]
MTPAPGNTLEWEGQTVLDRSGEKIGKIEEIFLVEETGRPEWALVKLGRIKSHTTLVPLTSARPVDDGVEVPYKKDKVSAAPEVQADGEPDDQQVTALYRHYGIATQPAVETGNGDGASAEPPTAALPQVYGNGHPPGDLRDAPIADVVKQVKEEASTLAGQELKLAKAEISEKAKEIGVGAGMFGGAGYVAYLASLALLLCVVFALAEVMPAWLASLIVAVVLGAVAGVLALNAKKRIKRAGPPIPEQTVESVKQTIETVKEEAKWGLGQTR